MEIDEIKEEFKEILTTKNLIMINAIDIMQKSGARILCDTYLLAYRNIIEYMCANNISVQEIKKTLSIPFSDSNIYTAWERVFKEPYKNIPRKNKLQRSLERYIPDQNIIDKILTEVQGD